MRARGHACPAPASAAEQTPRQPAEQGAPPGRARGERGGVPARSPQHVDAPPLAICLPRRPLRQRGGPPLQAVRVRSVGGEWVELGGGAEAWRAVCLLCLAGRTAPAPAGGAAAAPGPAAAALALIADTPVALSVTSHLTSRALPKAMPLLAGQSGTMPSGSVAAAGGSAAAAAQGSAGPWACRGGRAGGGRL